MLCISGVPSIFPIIDSTLSFICLFFHTLSSNIRHLCQLHSLILASKSGAGRVPTSGKAPTGIPSLSCLVCSLVCWGMREGTGRNTQVGLENPAGQATAVTVPYTGGSSLAWPRPCSTGPAGPWAAGSRGAAATELRAHEQKVK